MSFPPSSPPLDALPFKYRRKSFSADEDGFRVPSPAPSSWVTTSSPRAPITPLTSPPPSRYAYASTSPVKTFGYDLRDVCNDANDLWRRGRKPRPQIISHHARYGFGYRQASAAAYRNISVLMRDDELPPSSNHDASASSSYGINFRTHSPPFLPEDEDEDDDFEVDFLGDRPHALSFSTSAERFEPLPIPRHAHVREETFRVSVQSQTRLKSLNTELASKTISSNINGASTSPDSYTQSMHRTASTSSSVSARSFSTAPTSISPQSSSFGNPSSDFEQNQQDKCDMKIPQKCKEEDIEDMLPPSSPLPLSSPPLSPMSISPPSVSEDRVDEMWLDDVKLDPPTTPHERDESRASSINAAFLSASAVSTNLDTNLTRPSPTSLFPASTFPEPSSPNPVQIPDRRLQPGSKPLSHDLSLQEASSILQLDSAKPPNLIQTTSSHSPRPTPPRECTSHSDCPSLSTLTPVIPNHPTPIVAVTLTQPPPTLDPTSALHVIPKKRPAETEAKQPLANKKNRPCPEQQSATETCIGGLGKQGSKTQLTSVVHPQDEPRNIGASLTLATAGQSPAPESRRSALAPFPSMQTSQSDLEPPVLACPPTTQCTRPAPNPASPLVSVPDATTALVSVPGSTFLPRKKSLEHDTKQPLANKKNQPHPGQSASLRPEELLLSESNAHTGQRRQNSVGIPVPLEGKEKERERIFVGDEESERKRAEVWDAMGEAMFEDPTMPTATLKQKEKASGDHSRGSQERERDKDKDKTKRKSENKDGGPLRKKPRREENSPSFAPAPVQSSSKEAKNRAKRKDDERGRECESDSHKMKDEQSKSKSRFKSNNQRKAKRRSRSRSASPARSLVSSSSEYPHTDIPELPGLLITALATTRASSLPASALYKAVVAAQPALRDVRVSALEHALEAEWKRSGVFGKVESSGKDDAGRPMEAQWFYVPERDEDRDRAALMGSMMPRPGKRSETKKYKQYYWRPLEKISRWDPEDAM